MTNLRQTFAPPTSHNKPLLISETTGDCPETAFMPPDFKKLGYLDSLPIRKAASGGTPRVLPATYSWPKILHASRVDAKVVIGC